MRPQLHVSCARLLARRSVRRVCPSEVFLHLSLACLEGKCFLGNASASIRPNIGCLLDLSH
ncbi:hypothetical protein JI435_406910 [Parastagonospora nodorum SN15]|uniref:Uncharacterized protein n=1 Tax=Phaeosphaeria nodorum (strain SN15 / ATCC MYA-4574 / FGSC 10173) TaxID=321614 RepID=A0A7U2HX49_PHANO|nr:hypothetical protein JI435_406910 [Parastagonospora nodorum SN15]